MRLATGILPLAVLCGALTAADIPRTASALSINRLNGPPLELSTYRGKVVALTFIYTTCTHCQALTVTLNSLAAEYAPRGVQFVECAFNADAETTMQQFLDRYHPPFPVGWATDAIVRSFLQVSYIDTRPLYVPHMVFIDRAGMIRDDYRGEGDFFLKPEANIRAELEKLLAPKKPASAPPSHP